MIKDQNNNITNDVPIDVPIAGTDLFADSEDFLNELTDSELAQVTGGRILLEDRSDLTLLLCTEQGLGPIWPR